MPIFDYYCPDCETTSPDVIVTNPAPNTLPCECGELMKRLIGMPSFRTELATMDSADDIFEGMGVDGFDGVNEAHYQSTKAFF